ncbi:geranylgeranyl reductase [Candidatus Magnetomorum sp. HK-1]|nr:geranylgeranyl reductase [Candidatus Magnetomorum sp. HK-1]
MKADIAIIGAGSSGAAAACLLAQKGYQVVLLERRNQENAGARWINDVPPWMFEYAGIEMPEPPEKVVDFAPFVLRTQNGKGRVYIDQRPMWGIDMRLLIKRLHQKAEKLGVTLIDQCQITDVIIKNNRPIQIALKRNDFLGKSQQMTYKANLFVDASGVTQALLRKVPALDAICPQLPPQSYIHASQGVFEIIDRAGAKNYLETLGEQTGTFICFPAIEGGYSTLMLYINPNFDHVDILTGVVNDGHHGTGETLIHTFRKAQAWIGDRILGGSARIPLHRPYNQFVTEGAALIGDAACHVFPAHGSGVGSGMIAARMLTDAISQYDDPGRLEALWQYQARFQKDRGAVHAAYHVFSTMIQSMSEDDVKKLIEKGLMTKENIISSLNQQLPVPGIESILSMLVGSASAPFIAFKFLTQFPKLAAASVLFSYYPDKAEGLSNHSWKMISSLME